MQTALLNVGFEVNKAYIYRILRKWGWRKCKSDARQLQKFTMLNILQYIRYVEIVSNLRFSSLRYMDECSFAPRSKLIWLY
jgi:hypothetical protein